MAASRIVSGPNSLSGRDYEGLTVSEIRERLAEDLELRGEETASINNTPVDDDAVLSAGDRLVFTRQAGVKG